MRVTYWYFGNTLRTPDFYLDRRLQISLRPSNRMRSRVETRMLLPVRRAR